MLAKYSLQKDCYHYTMILPSGILLVGLNHPALASAGTKNTPIYIGWSVVNT